MKRVLSFVLMILLLSGSALFAQTGKYGVGTNEEFRGPVGLETYSLRATTKVNPIQTLEYAKKFGFKYLELDGSLIKSFTAKELLDLLEKYGLKAICAHWSFDELKNDPESVAKKAKELGLEAVGCAWIGHKKPFDEEDCRNAIAVFNKAGAVLAKEGIRFFYHNHGYEFHPYKDGTLMDLLIKETDPNFVSFQMDILWTVFPGQDPVALLKKYPNRWYQIHLKDLKKGVKGDLSGGTSLDNDVAIGSGQADYPAILKAAQEIGVKYYFIEDESPVVLDQIPQSLKYLESVQFPK